MWPDPVLNLGIGPLALESDALPNALRRPAATFMTFVFFPLPKWGLFLTLLHSKQPTLWSFGSSECNRVKGKSLLLQE